MRPKTLLVERAGHAFVQDLGRPGHGGIGIAENGALDQDAARTANILVGNAESSPLIEVTGSELAFVAVDDLLLAVTGAAEQVVIDGHAQPAWEALAVSRHARIVVPLPRLGHRSYVAVNGTLRADRALGSVAPDHLLGVGNRVSAGERLVVDSSYDAHAGGDLGRVFRLGARRPQLSSPATVRVTEGPDLQRLTHGRADLETAFAVLPQSDHVGLRLEGDAVEQNSREEILSRGVPIGAVEVPPTGGLLILLRGRLVTAGYPVVAVVTTASLDVLGQVGPGDSLALRFCGVAAARATLRQRVAERSALTERVRSAFTAKGLSQILDRPVDKTEDH